MVETNRKRYYTVGEANQALARIEPVVRALSERAGALRGMRASPGGPGQSRPAPETRVEPGYFRELLALYSDIQELRRHGCELKDLTSGIVDFPALLQGREVYLCWKLGEDAILHWHEVDAGFRGRQPIDSESGFEGEGTEGR